MSGRLADAILVARSVHDNFPDLLSKRISIHPTMDAGSPFSTRGVPVNESGTPNTIRNSIQTMAAKSSPSNNYDLKIVMIPAKVALVVRDDGGEMKSPDRIIRSILQRYPSRATIRILDNLNPCWTRFVICKELAHLIMGDGQGARAQSLNQQLSMAYAISNNAKPETELSGEQFAWFVAAELMMPRIDRDEFLNRHNSGEDPMMIARSYWIPRALLDLFVDKSYAEISAGL